MEERTINLLDIYRKLKLIEQSMVTKEELDAALEEVIVISNEDTMRQIEESEKDIKSGKVKKINSYKSLENIKTEIINRQFCQLTNSPSFLCFLNSLEKVFVITVS